MPVVKPPTSQAPPVQQLLQRGSRRRRPSGSGHVTSLAAAATLSNCQSATIKA